jgi:hypothetical protein
MVDEDHRGGLYHPIQDFGDVTGTLCDGDDLVRCPTKRSQARNTRNAVCCSSVFIATKHLVGRCATMKYEAISLSSESSRRRRLQFLMVHIDAEGPRCQRGFGAVSRTRSSLGRRLA